MWEGRRMTLRALVAVVAAWMLTFAAAPAQGAALKPCRTTSTFPLPTLAVRGMACSDAKIARRRLYEDHPEANQTPYGATHHFKTTGRTRGKVRTLRCSVHYGPGAGSNSGGLQLTIRCRDFRQDGFTYTEQQDGE